MAREIRATLARTTVYSTNECTDRVPERIQRNRPEGYRIIPIVGSNVAEARARQADRSGATWAFPFRAESDKLFVGVLLHNEIYEADSLRCLLRQASTVAANLALPGTSQRPIGLSTKPSGLVPTHRISFQSKSSRRGRSLLGGRQPMI